MPTIETILVVPYFNNCENHADIFFIFIFHNNYNDEKARKFN